MSTLAPDRLAELAETWRRGLDDEELPNPAGPRFGEDGYTEYEITMTGVTTQCTIFTGSFDVNHGMCFCCRVE